MAEQPDPERLEALMQTVAGDIKGHMTGIMGVIGDRLGLFRALARGPATPAELAERAEVNPRYAREWLSAMTCAGYVEHDGASGQFWMTPEQIEVLANDGGPACLAGLFQEQPGFWEIVPRVERCFREGGGVSLDEYGEDLWQGMERFIGTWFDNLLVQQWVPQADGVQQALESGARVADIGCGSGRALVKLASSFPEMTGVGYDLSERNLERAREHAQQVGVADRLRFERRDVVQGLPERFDLVTTFDAAHDLTDTQRGFQSIRDALEPGGSCLVLEFRVGDRLEDNVGLTGAMFYSVSTLYCMTTALAAGGEGIGTCGLPESKVRELCSRAGFSSVEVVPFDNPFNVLYQAKA